MRRIAPLRASLHLPRAGSLDGRRSRRGGFSTCEDGGARGRLMRLGSWRAVLLCLRYGLRLRLQQRSVEVTAARIAVVVEDGYNRNAVPAYEGPGAVGPAEASAAEGAVVLLLRRGLEVNGYALRQSAGGIDPLPEKVAPYDLFERLLRTRDLHEAECCRVGAGWCIAQLLEVSAPAHVVLRADASRECGDLTLVCAKLTVAALAVVWVL